MKGFVVELRNHPAQKTFTDPVSGEVLALWDDQDRPVQLVPDQHGIYLNGVLAGYCGKTPGRPMSLIRYYPDELSDLMKSHIEQEVGAVKCVGRPIEPAPDPNRPEPETEIDDDDGDDD